MKSTNAGVSEGVIVFILGMLLGALLAFVMIEYGTREARKAIANMSPPDPNRPPPAKVIFDGKGFVREETG